MVLRAQALKDFELADGYCVLSLELSTGGRNNIGSNRDAPKIDAASAKIVVRRYTSCDPEESL